MKQIVAIISPNGETTVESKGFTGDSCIKATRLLEQSIGNVTHEKRKSEYYQDQATQTKQKEIDS